ncbi:hypothetical protein [Fictibacillus terranigra]|uniref:hypothetical protein n=1 Tax=Fictibacillus terranigra TaxID=3058424 RepID=UPI00339049A8
MTNSPSVALALCNLPHVQIISIGGEFDKKKRVNKGSFTIKEIEKIHIEFCLLGISSIDSNLGITVPSYVYILNLTYGSKIMVKFYLCTQNKYINRLPPELLFGGNDKISFKTKAKKRRAKPFLRFKRILFLSG